MADGDGIMVYQSVLSGFLAAQTCRPIHIMTCTRASVAFNLLLFTSIRPILVLHIYSPRNDDTHTRNSTQWPLIRTILRVMVMRARKYHCISHRLGIYKDWFDNSRGSLVDGGNKVFVLRELLVSWPHEGLERDAFIGLDILNQTL